MSQWTKRLPASELNWGFKSPQFHGNGYSTHVLSVEQLQHNRRQDIKDEQARVQRELERELENTTRISLLKMLKVEYMQHLVNRW